MVKITEIADENLADEDLHSSTPVELIREDRRSAISNYFWALLTLVPFWKPDQSGYQQDPESLQMQPRRYRPQLLYYVWVVPSFITSRILDYSSSPRIILSYVWVVPNFIMSRPRRYRPQLLYYVWVVPNFITSRIPDYSSSRRIILLYYVWVVPNFITSRIPDYSSSRRIILNYVWVVPNYIMSRLPHYSSRPRILRSRRQHQVRALIPVSQDSRVIISTPRFRRIRNDHSAPVVTRANMRKEARRNKKRRTACYFDKFGALALIASLISMSQTVPGLVADKKHGTERIVTCCVASACVFGLDYLSLYLTWENVLASMTRENDWKAWLAILITGVVIVFLNCMILSFWVTHK